MPPAGQGPVPLEPAVISVTADGCLIHSSSPAEALVVAAFTAPRTVL